MFLVHLFLSFYGKGYCRLARNLNQFFTKHMKIAMTPTTARRLVECTVRTGVENVIVTEADAASVNRTLGHSKHVFDRFYRMEIR